MRRIACVLAAGALATGVVTALPTGAGADPAAPVVVMSGLNNPRQLSLVGTDELLIAEAGRGGDLNIGPGPEGTDVYVGATGSISVVDSPATASNQTPNRVVTGLMSGAAQDGSAAVGSDGVSSLPTGGPIYIQETYFPRKNLPSDLQKQNGRLLRAHTDNPHRKAIANIARFEADNDPDGHGFDSDPYAVLARPGGELVADAAGNDLLWVSSAGEISVVHVFPNVTTGACAGQFDPDPSHPGCNFVPTSIAVDRKGHIFVGGLSSLVPGEAQVVELSADGSKVLKTIGGFTAVTGVAVDNHGGLYVSQLFAPQANPPSPQITGVLTKIARDGTRTDVDVPFPSGLAVVGQHTVYVSAFSIAPDTGLGGPGTSGQVWRLKV
jgi:hypothetical protein